MHAVSFDYVAFTVIRIDVSTCSVLALACCWPRAAAALLSPIASFAVEPLLVLYILSIYRPVDRKKTRSYWPHNYYWIMWKQHPTSVLRRVFISAVAWASLYKSSGWAFVAANCLFPNTSYRPVWMPILSTGGGGRFISRAGGRSAGNRGNPPCTLSNARGLRIGSPLLFRGVLAETLIKRLNEITKLWNELTSLQS